MAPIRKPRGGRSGRARPRATANESGRTSSPADRSGSLLEATRQANNQPPPLTGYNLFLSDPVLCAAVERDGAGWCRDQLREFGEFLGTEQAQQWGFEANENEPVLHTHDRFGNRIDEVSFHPSWHSLMRHSIEQKIHSLPWAKPRKGAHVARAALLMLAAQNEAGHMCPISMTFSSIAALRADPELARQWEPQILSPRYDPRFLPAKEKSGVLIGMGMTEKQGGSDVRATITRAERIGNSREYLITGHKWFCSAPMCDAFLVLAQAQAGLSCFLLPRWTPAGERNEFHIQHLKRKMGNRSNASSEVEFLRAWAHLIGEEGRGIPTIIEMVHHTRLDCAVASAALMRQALVQAFHHCRHRKAFGKSLIEQPLMRNVLADLALESNAATLLMSRLAVAFDLRGSDPGERAFARVATAAAKFWLCKRAAVQVGEALECLGGNGYVEESIMPRLYREAPLYSIWEGSGNVICLDFLRAIAKEPDCVDSLVREFRLARGANRTLDSSIAQIENDLARQSRELRQECATESEQGARRLVGRTAVALQASLMVRFSPPSQADAFCESRLAPDREFIFGTLPRSTDFSSILGAIATGLPE